MKLRKKTSSSWGGKEVWCFTFTEKWTMISVCNGTLSADIFLSRQLIPVGHLLDFNIAFFDLNGAYTRFGQIQREQYMRPSYSIFCLDSLLFKFVRLSYETVQSRRQWLSVIDQWLINVYHLPSISAVDHLSHCPRGHRLIKIFVADVVGDFLETGWKQVFNRFSKTLYDKCKLDHRNKVISWSFLYI